MLIADISSFCKLGIPSPIINDWIAITAYALTSYICLRAGYLASRLQYKKETRFWQILGSLVLIFGINKFLYSESCITYGLSMLAHSEGWYELRRSFQAEFIVLIVFILLCLLVAILYALKDLLRSLKSAAIGFMLLLLLIIIRTVSLHQIDALMFQKVLGLNVTFNWLIELSCNFWVGLSALVYSKRLLPSK